MEIAIWVIVLTTLITAIQTWFMWYFSQHVKLEDSEMDELVDKLEDNEDPVAYVSEDRMLEQIGSLYKAVDEQMDDHWNAVNVTNTTVSNLVNRLDSVQELVDEMLDAVEGVYAYLEEFTQKQEQAIKDVQVYQSAVPSQSVQSYEQEVEDEVEDEVMSFPERESVVVESNQDFRQGYRKPVPRKNPTELYIEALGAEKVQELMENNVGEFEEVDDDSILRGPRKDGEPMIMDLRAQPFEESTETLEGVYDLPPVGDGFEVMNTRGTGGRPMPRQRGFRNL